MPGTSRFSPSPPSSPAHRTIAILPACTPSITKHPVCIEPDDDERARRSYRFHNRRGKNSSRLVPPLSHLPRLLSLSRSLALYPPSLVFLSPQGSLMEQARPTFDRTKDYRPDSLARNHPFPSKIDSRDEPPLRPVRFQAPFLFTRPPSCRTYSPDDLVSTRGRVEDGRGGMALPDRLSPACAPLQRAVAYKLPKIGPLFEATRNISRHRYNRP